MSKGYKLGLKWDFTGVAVQLGEKKNSNSHTFCMLCDQLTCVVTPHSSLFYWMQQLISRAYTNLMARFPIPRCYTAIIGRIWWVNLIRIIALNVN